MSFISKLIPAFLPFLLLADTKSATSAAEAPQATPPKVIAPVRKAAPSADSSAPGDTILRVMRDEIGRSRLLSVANLDVPYYVEYALDDAQNLTVTASFGGLVSVNNSRVRLPHHPGPASAITSSITPTTSIATTSRVPATIRIHFRSTTITASSVALCGFPLTVLTRRQSKPSPASARP